MGLATMPVPIRLSDRVMDILLTTQWYAGRMTAHRLLLESLPASESVSRLRAEGKITADMTSVWIGFGAIELKREVRLTHRRFPNGGSWSFFLCPRCDRRVRRLRLNDGRPDVRVLLRQLPSHFIRLARAAVGGEGAADGKTCAS